MSYDPSRRYYSKSADKRILLDDFNIKVKNKRYSKVAYSIWRELNNINDVDLHFCFDWNQSVICVAKYDSINLNYVIPEPENRIDFYISDGSFGEFLYDHFFAFTSIPEESNKIDEATSSIDNLKTAFASSKTSIENLCNSIGSYTIAVDNHSCYDCSNYKEKKETKNMNTSSLFNFDFGPASSNQFRMSPYGLAIHTQTNGWVAYNAKTGDLMDVDILNFDISKMIYKMPVALNAIKPGDILMHGGKPVFVREVATSGNTVRVIDYTNATVADILPVKSPFGFNFFTKVCPLFNFDQVNANNDNPFGNMLPFLMMSGENNDFDPTLLMMASMMMNNNQNLTQNPMMMYFLMNRSDKNDILPFLMMNNNMFAAAPVNPPAASK